ncbi:MAG: DUF3800 domain-containing protein [Rhodospirillales bacterium]|nr:DUF3800 domain-containing protein [Rhodospirillales bacterium]
MSWLLFMDESGHDHKNMPFEVRGGVAIHAGKVWPFVSDWHKSVKEAFGPQFSELRGEIKGNKLLDRKRIEWSNQMALLDASARHNAVNRFLTKKLQRERPTRRDFTGYGQASRLMARYVFDILDRHGAVLFASLIPRGVRQPRNFKYAHYLRKDHVFLQERFFYFLEAKQEHGLFVMDQTEKQNDKRFVKRLQDYYTKTQTGISRTQWVVPTPLFVDSEMSPGVQAADLCLYCINWGFRRSEWNFKGPMREEIHTEFGGRVGQLQFKGEGYDHERTFRTFGIVHVPDPYTARGIDDAK